MTLLKKMLQDQTVLDPNDSMFEDFILKTIANPRLMATQKANIIREASKIAETPYQEQIVKSYLAFADGMTNGELAFNWGTLGKAMTMLLCAETLLRTAEMKRKGMYQK